MKINSFNNLNFQKKLAAKCAVLKNGEQNSAQIYLLDKNHTDGYEITKLLKDKNWKNNHYLNGFYSNYLYYPNDNETYVMQDDNGNTLALGCIMKNYSNKNNLYFLESAPMLAKGAQNREYKYIGETMLAFLVELSKRERKSLYISYVADRKSTKDFYFKQCGFEKINEEKAILKKRKAGKFIRANEKHTGSAIEFMI